MAEEWNGAHKVLLDTLSLKKSNLYDWEKEVELVGNKLAQVMNNRDEVKKTIEQIEQTIVTMGYEPKVGYDIWGAEVVRERERAEA